MSIPVFRRVRFKGLLLLAIELLLLNGIFASVPAEAAPHAFWLDYNGQQVRLLSVHDTVAAVLHDNFLRVLPGDEISPAPNSAIAPGARIQFRSGSHLVIRQGNLVINVERPVATVAEALRSAGIELAAGDVVYPALASRVTPGLQVWLLGHEQRPGGAASMLAAVSTGQAGYEVDLASGRHSVGLLVEDGGRPSYHRVVAGTVAEALAAFGVAIRPGDRVSPAPDQPLSDGMSITVVRVDRRSVTVNVVIPHGTRQVSDPTALRGTSTVIQPGSDGLDAVDQEVLFENGTEVGRTEISRRHLRDAVDQIISVGTRLPVNALPADPDFNFTREIPMYATAYAAPGGYTASGKPAGYGNVAVDPNVIRLGTHLYVSGYGFAWAADTGGAIKGNRIDLGFDSNRQAEQYGVAHVTVWVLDH